MTSARYKEYISKYNLRRFVDAHRQIYSSALNEIRSGEKQCKPPIKYPYKKESL